MTDYVLVYVAIGLVFAIGTIIIIKIRRDADELTIMQQESEKEAQCLWAIDMPGCLAAAPSKTYAEQEAINHNAMCMECGINDISATVTKWPYGRKAHSDALKRYSELRRKL